MPRREPMSPPALPGFEPVRLLGSGGYADVFLYEQKMPQRQVAVKVLVPDVLGGGDGREGFTAEANLMARVSAHPYIVQVFQADISADGRPFLVMEYYSGRNYHERAGEESFSVPEVLRVGVQLASAVETAHRAGILHHDIKPANILTSEYQRPGLTDFGIASGHVQTGPDGVSIPWAPPEALGGEHRDERADVYSLAATLYHLLAGRSPFEVRGADNGELALLGRVERAPVPLTGRTDVPARLERTLANAMAKDPSMRPGSAAELGRQLQAVESELQLTPTTLELAGESRPVRPRDSDEDDDATRVKGVVAIEAQPSNLIRDIGVAAVGPPPSPRRREGMLAEPDVADTRAPSSPGSSIEEDAGQPPRPLGLIVAVLCALLLVIGVGIATVVAGGSDDDGPDDLDQFEVNDALSGNREAAPGPFPVTSVASVENDDGTFTHTWDAPEGAAFFAVTVDGDDTSERVDDTSFVSSASCVLVEAVGEAGQIAAATRAEGCG